MRNDYRKFFDKPDNPALSRIKAERKQKQITNKFLDQQKPTSTVNEDEFEIHIEDISGGNFNNFDSKDYKISDNLVNSNEAMERIKRFTKSDIVETNEDRIKIAMEKYKGNICKKIEYTSKIKTLFTEIISGIINIVAIILIVFSCDYKETQLFSSTITSDQWEIIFIMIIIFYAIFIITTTVRLIYFAIMNFKVKEMNLKEFVDILMKKTK